MRMLGDWKWYAALTVFMLFTGLVVWWPPPGETSSARSVSTDADEEFKRDVQAELARAAEAGESFGAHPGRIAFFGIQIANGVIKMGDGRQYMFGEVVESTNPAILAGDLIVSCNGQLLRPGRDMAIIMQQHPSDTGEYALMAMRDGVFREITARAHLESFSDSQIRERQMQDAIEAVELNRLVAANNLPAAWDVYRPDPTPAELDAMLRYTVQEDDTVASLARLFGVSEDDLRWANHFPEGGEFAPGDSIWIPVP